MRKLVAAVVLLAGSVQAQAIRGNAGFNARLVPRNDDGSTALQQLGFTINFFGKQRSHAYVNNNGNITFDNALATYTPFGLEGTQREIIAAFFADVDTRSLGSKVVTYGTDTIENRRAFGVNYVDVGYYSSHSDKLNSFQLIVIDRSDVGPGNFDIEFNYARISWETGDASGGVNGYGGVPASVGWSNGSGEPGTSFELDGSLVAGSFLDGGRRALNRNRLNTTVPGRYVFRARNGQILPPLTITTGCPLPAAFAATPYAFRFNAVGGTQYRWAMVADPGAPLPPGFTLTETGNFSGTPTGPGTHDFTVRLTSVTEEGEQTATKRCSLTVRPPSLNITTGCPLPAATAGQPYSRTLQVAGGRAPYTWTLAEQSSPLPAGLSLSSNGALSGVPASPGTTVITLQVSSNPSDGAEPALKTCNLTVNPAMLDLTSSCSLPSGTSGVPYSQVLSVSGGASPYEWSAIGSLPPGLTLSEDGRLEGTPASPGNATFTARVRDSRGNVRSQSCGFRVDAPVLDVPTACPLPPATSGQAYSQRLTVAGGAGPYSWSVLGSLPTGLSLSSDGVLSGLPGGSGPFGFRLFVSDAEGHATTKGCTLMVARSDFGLTSCPLPNASVGTTYSTTLRVTGGTEPYYFSAGGLLPSGLTLGSSGLVSGSPRQAGSFPMVVRVMDSVGRTSTQSCQLTVTPSVVQILGACPMPDARVGTAYLQNFTASGGSQPYAFRIDGKLPSGLTMAANGSVSGLAVSTGTSDFEVEVRDAQGRSVSKLCSLKVTLPDFPALRLSSVPATMNAAVTGPTVAVNLDHAYTLPIQGDLILSSEADTGNGEEALNRPDPRVRFTTGQRVVPFSIAPGARQFSAQVVTTGTVAGTTTIKVDNIRVSSNPVLTLPSPSQYRVARTAPAISNACFAPAPGGIGVTVTGYSTTRQLNNAIIRLTPGSAAQERSFTVDVAGSGYDYYSTDESIRNGGAFTLTIPFAIEGSEVNAVSLELTNSAGSTTVQSVQRCR